MEADPGPLNPTATGLAEQVHAHLLRRSETVAAAESLTAGLVCAALTSVPGASATVRGGLVVYATDLKASLAGVSADLLATRGAVDPQVANELAHGVRTRLAADWGLGLTGVAGPEPQDGVAVGTVFLGLVGPGCDRVVELRLTGDRAQIRAEAVRATLLELARTLAGRG